MTCTNAAGSDSTRADRVAATRTKAVLFCPECDFRGPAGESWRVRTAPGRRDVYCPRCGHQVS